jgi:hypothetical protein
MSGNMKELLLEVISEEQLQKLVNIGYFIDPASVKHHSAYEGGLARHSYSVTNVMLKVNDALNLGLDRKSIILAGMFHDLGKVGCYTQNILKSNEQSISQPYKYDTVFELGNTSSLFLLNQLNIVIDIDVAQAIYWHHGFEYPRDTIAYNNLRKQPIDMMLVLLLQFADNLSSCVLES